MMDAFRTTSPEETMELGVRLSETLKRGDIVGLSGDLGAGKTHLVKGICRGFGVREPVTSPTFVLLNRYEGTDAAGRELLVYHFDLYRIRSAAEIYDLGYEEFLHGDGVSLIEWAGTLGGLLPDRAVSVHLSLGAEETERLIEIRRTGSGR
jgi:tRNA threonylcarbamoyladenosine biosynthesis protein TsaE